MSPAGAPSHGTKVTPSEAPTTSENAGSIASDSLAAESARAGGAFASNRGDIQSVSGSNSTFANTNTSGATTLPASANSSTRDASSSDPSYQQSRAHAVEYTSGPTSTGKGDTGSSSADVAPSYVNNQYIRDEAGPHGANLKETREGERFEGGEGKNASFTADIGSKNDPGRLAEQQFQKRDAMPGADAGYAKDRGSVKGEGQFDALGGETEA